MRPRTEPRPAMRRIGHALVDAYRKDDRIARLMAAEARPGDDGLTCQRWLSESPAKRLIFDMLYGDLVDDQGLRILDIGGGLTALTRRLAERHAYELVDLMVHDPPERAAALRASSSGLVVHVSDWWRCDFAGRYDIVLANDLFPNADQRLSLFLERVLPIARLVRLSLTYYNHPRFYLTKRVDADEILCLLAWDGRQTAAALAPFRDRVVQPDFTLFDETGDSVFDNGRQVSVVALRGDAFDG